MFEREQLRDEFSEILDQQRQIAERLDRILADLADATLREQLVEMREHTQRHLDLTERLVEIVS